MNGVETQNTQCPCSFQGRSDVQFMEQGPTYRAGFALYIALGCSMRFVDSAVNVAKRFSIGREIDSGRHYLSIPMANRLVDYEEYYEISAELHDGYPANESLLDSFASECREQKHDTLLLQKPGGDRGVAT
jgi:hypothetical protein